MNTKEISVAITGIGIITPGVTDMAAMASWCGKTDRTLLKKVEPVPAPPDMNPGELRRMAPLTRLALYASHKAFQGQDMDPKDCGLLIGLTHGSTSFLKEFHDFLFDYGPQMASPNAFSNGVTNAPLGALSKNLGITGGGGTLVGYEQCGMLVLDRAARLIDQNVFTSCCAGAAEEYSEIVEDAYKTLSWYTNALSGGVVVKPSAPTQYYPAACRRDTNALSGGVVVKPSAPAQYYPVTCRRDNGEEPAYLPCPFDHATPLKNGFILSEASVFFFLTSTPREKKACCFFSPVPDLATFDTQVDLIISGAGGGPQDEYELSALQLALSSQKKPPALLFSKPFFGETFAAGALLSGAIAYDILVNNQKYPSFPVHASLKNKVQTGNDTDFSGIRSILVIAAGRDKQLQAGLFTKDSRIAP